MVSRKINTDAIDENLLIKHELTVGGYIDLILERHLEENQEEINGLLRKEIDDWNV